MTARADLYRALGALAEPPDAGHGRIAVSLGLDGEPDAADYASLFLFQCYPYASVHLGPDGMLGGEAQDRVAGFWRALGIVPPAEPDHLAALLGLLAAIVDGEAAATEGARAALRRTSRKAVLWEHLLSWLPPYLDKVAELAPPYYLRWARLLGDALTAEASELGPPETLPLHLREMAGLPGPDEPSTAWLAALLSSARTGMIVTRADLRRASGDLELGSRIGERSYMLRALFEQDARGTAAWLADEADRWIVRHLARDPALELVSGFWAHRAAATAAALRSAAADRLASTVGAQG